MTVAMLFVLLLLILFALTVLLEDSFAVFELFLNLIGVHI